MLFCPDAFAGQFGLSLNFCLVFADPCSDQRLHVFRGLEHDGMGIGKQSLVVASVVAQVLQVGVDPVGNLAGFDLGGRQLCVHLVLHGGQRLQALDDASKVGGLGGHVGLAQAGVQCSDVLLQSYDSAVDNLGLAAVLFFGKQIFSHGAVLLEQLVQHVGGLGGAVHRFDLGQHLRLGALECFAPGLHFLDLGIEVHKVFIGLRLANQLVAQEVTQPGFKRGEVVGQRQLTGDGDERGRQCFNRRSHHGGGGLGGHVGQHVSLDLFPGGNDLGAKVWVGLVPERCKRLAIAGGEQAFLGAGQHQALLHLRVVLWRDNASAQAFDQRGIGRLVLPSHFLHERKAVERC